jgi:hypothetical protein
VPHPADPTIAFLDSAAMIAERAFHRVIFGFLVPAGFVHKDSQTMYCRQSLLFFFCRWSFIRFVSLKYKRPPVSAALAEIDLADIPSGNRKDIPAFADRTVQHIQQLYMSIRHKN